jgi:hypothetical protein
VEEEEEEVTLKQEQVAAHVVGVAHLVAMMPEVAEVRKVEDLSEALVVIRHKAILSAKADRTLTRRLLDT